MTRDYTYILTFNTKCPDGEWRILDISTTGASQAMFDDSKITFRYPNSKSDDGTNVPPQPVRQKYEELLGRPEFIGYGDPPSMTNVVELLADEDDCAWDQPCAFGHRVESHAVYCHNDKWLYAPSKCKRNRTDWPHEKCRGFKPNPLIASPSPPSPIPEG